MADVLQDEVAQGDELPAVIENVGSSYTNEMPPESEKGPDAGHGNRFQSKLLMLFCIRAINAGYKFYLGTELLDQGNKFDDLIFKYTKDKNADNTGDNWPYQYLQAKSRLYEKDDKITVKDLFSVPVKGKNIHVDFSLPKYFRSYCEITRRGDKVNSCIICTNINFENKKSLEEKGIEINEVQLTDDPILKFEKLSDDKIPTRYKIEIKREDLSSILKEETASKLLAKMLCGKKPLNSKFEVIRNYHMALVNENVIDLVTKKFRGDFINGCNGLSEGAMELRKNILGLVEKDNDWNSFILSLDKNFGKTPLQPKEFNYPLPIAIKDKEIGGFFDKLVFAVNTPNEDELDDVLKREVGNYFTLLSADLQSAYVMNKMVNWFKRESNVWLSSEEAKELFLNKTHKIMESIRVNAISIDYQNQLKKGLMGLEFNSDSIQVMTEKLRPLLESTSSSVIIGTDSPQHTAVKIISAIKTLPNFKYNDSFLVTSSKRLEDEAEMKKFKGCLESKKDSHTLLVVVCDSEVSKENYRKYANLVPDGRKDNKTFKIIIVIPDKTAEITDDIKYMDFTDEFKQKFLSLKVSFQLKKDLGQQEIEQNKITVGDLIGDKPEKVIDFSLLKELTQTGHEIKIPSFDDTTDFEEHMYIKRHFKCPFHDKFEDELAKSLGCTVNQLRGECRICPDGRIVWLVQDKRQKEIWEKIKDVANQSYSSSGVIHEDNHLIPFKANGNEKTIVIISGVAGSGKSTLLSHYYRKIKEAKPDYWIIRINLVHHYEAIFKLDNDKIDLDDVFNLFSKQLRVVDDKSLFSCSLLRNRLKTGDRIIFMFDGFDEIDDRCQEKAIQLMKAITKDKSIQLYVTTRPHMLDKLKSQLFQLPFSLENIRRDDQVKYMTKLWQKEINIPNVKVGLVKEFAESLVHLVSKTLKDEESSFIGIPLQCRIVAECFQSDISAEILKKDYDGNGAGKLVDDLLDGQKFDLANMYERLMQTKRRVFREEKTKIPVSSGYNIDYLIKDIENHLTKLAIETIVTDQKTTEVLWPSQSSHRSHEDLVAEQNLIALNGLNFGLTSLKSEDNNTKVQFLHRTYAEYLFARYLYKGFHLDDKRHNRLLDNESIRILILNKILARPEYDGVQVFFNSMLKELVDDKEWRKRIDGRDLPDWITKFTKSFYRPFLCQDIPPQVTVFTIGGEWKSSTTHYHGYDFENTLHFSLMTGKKIVFTFLCDCLDATCDKELVKIVMMKSFMYKGSYFSFEFFRNTESKLFKRFIDYLDGEADTVMSKLTGFSSNLPPSNLEYSQWNGEEQKETVHYLLEFMANQREAFEKHFNLYREITLEPMLTFLIFNENYENHLKLFLKLLSRSTSFSDDYNFSNLLKKSFCTKNHFRSGRIEKTLAILCGLKRNSLLIRMHGTVLTIEPAAFQSIYMPLPLVGDEDVTAMDFNILMERDSYGMTCLHRAAFYGDTEGVEKILERIRQNLGQENETENKVVNVMARDEYGFTPFYVAAALGKEEIYHQMLAFLKETLPLDVLKGHLMNTKAFVRRALYDAIESENIQMFQLILKAVKINLGQEELIRVIRLPKSFFVECKTNELFNAMAKIVVMRGDNVANYTDFCDLVFHDAETTKTLEYIDAENLQGLLSLKSVEDFTKQLLDNSNFYNIGFRLLPKDLLRHFTKDQLEQFVETISSKNNFRKIGGISPDFVKSDKLNDPAEVELIAVHFLNLGWTKEDLEFHDQGNGFTAIHIKERLVPRNSYWRDFIISAAKINFTHCEDGLGFLKEILDIFDCLKEGGVSDSFLKKLLLHEDGKGFIMIQLSLEAVKRMLTYLSKESQEEVKRKWKNNAPPMDTFFSSNLKLQNSDSIMFKARYWTNILRFYLEYGREDHLKEFVNMITALRSIGVERRSVWSYITEHCNKEEKTKEILKLVSEKTDIFDQDAVKTMLLHEIDEIPLIIKAMVWGEDIEARLEILPKENREEIQSFIKLNAPGFIDQAFLNPQTHFKILESKNSYKRLNTLISFLNYSNDTQLEKFVQNITSAHLIIPNKVIADDSAPVQQAQTCSIWAELFTRECKHETDDIAKMDKFMECLSEKLGSNAVKELVLHNDGERPVIFYAALRKEKKTLETLFKYLSAKDRKKVQRQVDEFLDDHETQD